MPLLTTPWHRRTSVDETSGSKSPGSVRLGSSYLTRSLARSGQAGTVSTVTVPQVASPCLGTRRAAYFLGSANANGGELVGLMSLELFDPE